MSAPKLDLPLELRDALQKHVGGTCKCADPSDCPENLVREVVEIVARKSAEIADRAISQDASGYASTAILNHWGLK